MLIRFEIARYSWTVQLADDDITGFGQRSDWEQPSAPNLRVANFALLGSNAFANAGRISQDDDLLGWPPSQIHLPFEIRNMMLRNHLVFEQPRHVVVQGKCQG
jgi:hypothetical protein